ncbi:MAG: two-component regulator propeller domain-containing protein, partial [Chitinophagaceae bacterium]
MGRKFFPLVCFFACVNCVAQQYPFVYYTPKDGLVNSRVRSIKQDSKGRMWFITYGGLSVYDGTRFINYKQDNGLAHELVNDIAEVGPDSFLIATNTQVLNTLVKGKLGVYKTADGFCPVINRFLKSRDGKWYVTADDGLFVLEGSNFRRLSLIDKNANDLGAALDKIVEWKDFFLIIPWSQYSAKLLLYDRRNNKLLNAYTKEDVTNVATDMQNRIWLSGAKGIKIIDTAWLQNGEIAFLPLPAQYKNLADKRDVFIFFDKERNTWLYGGSTVEKISPELQQQSFSTQQGLKTGNLVDIFRDREGIIWMATDGNGVVKLNGTHIQILNSFSANGTSIITALQQQNDTVWFFNAENNVVHSLYKNHLHSYSLSGKKIMPSNIIIVGQKLYLVVQDKIICILKKNDIRSYNQPQIVHTDKATEKVFGASVADVHGGIIVITKKNDGTFSLDVLKDGKYLMDYPISYTADQMAFDRQGRLWVVTRDNHLIVFTIHPDQPGKYLQMQKDYFKELPQMSPRSITIDKNNYVWVGTRYNGLYRLEFNGGKLKSYRQFTTRNGLTDNFIYNLHADENNMIWIGTQAGLDKLFWKNDRYIISNIGKTYNFFQSVFKIITTKDNTAWAVTGERNILKISSSNISPVTPPALLLTSLEVNNRDYYGSKNSFSYKENNLSFHVAAPSFTDERSIRYGYLLEGSGNNNWSVPSNDAIFNVINLAPGKYSLKVRSEFPEAMYPAQTLAYPFIIKPPFWQTWWFIAGVGMLGIGALIFVIRFYYRRKLEKQIVILEKQQAIEKERTRIATDMHDDLGAGLSR